MISTIPVLGCLFFCKTHTEGETEELRGKLEVGTRGWMSIVTVINIVTCTGDHRMDALLLALCARVFLGGSGDTVHSHCKCIGGLLVQAREFESELMHLKEGWRKTLENIAHPTPKPSKN